MTRTTENRPLGKLDRVVENVAQSKSNPGNGILGRTSSLLVFRMPGDSEAWTFYGGVVTVTAGVQDKNDEVRIMLDAVRVAPEGHVGGVVSVSLV